MQLAYFQKELKLKETFAIAYGSYDKRDALMVQLSHAGKKGYGECVAINYYGINLAEFEVKLEQIRSKIESHKISYPTDFYDFLVSLNIPAFLLSALDCAYWDLFGKLENKNFAELNKLDNSKVAESSYTISIAPIEEQLKKMEKSEWSRFKVKCNHLDKKDFEVLANFHRPVALDSNASLKDEDCIWIQENPLAEKFLYLEQPLAIGKYHPLENRGYANWMADEDVQNITYLETLRPHYSSVNINLMKCGGLTPVLELIKKSKFLGYKVMLGCMTESSVGISAGCALGGLLDFADLDGANLISNDYAKGSYVDRGKIILSDKPGLGIELV